ncbi:MAG: YraN family protein [Armatimonadetes bacterium]|nr:YraN family protein [Armatimonadota bacterium]NIM22847.1 YraN family protein [Armatimonadota bacterium]NIM66713.1 YraN family protein [Armatimonadota bacterium]NIM75270.1 YraN family protein [Armatimonadota bacterium]NIN04910.1 YraN family protein [Armatimonadota bacterium]
MVLAKIGEEAAARLLRARGYRVLERNYRSRGGEIDIIARQGSELVFAEVKSRSREDFGTPAQGVGKGKRRKLVNLAQGYIANRLRREVAWRFDIVEVWLTPDGKVRRTNIIPGAFRPEV